VQAVGDGGARALGLEDGPSRCNTARKELRRHVPSHLI
jgi:hypothetical protein